MPDATYTQLAPSHALGVEPAVLELNGAALREVRDLSVWLWKGRQGEAIAPVNEWLCALGGKTLGDCLDVRLIGETIVAHLAPNRVLFLSDEAPDIALSPSALLLDRSGGYVVMSLTGAQAASVLNRRISMDITAARHAAPCALETRFGDVRVCVISKQNEYLLVVDQTYARYVWEELLAAIQNERGAS